MGLHQIFWAVLCHHPPWTLKIVLHGDHHPIGCVVFYNHLIFFLNFYHRQISLKYSCYLDWESMNNSIRKLNNFYDRPKKMDQLKPTSFVALNHQDRQLNMFWQLSWQLILVMYQSCPWSNYSFDQQTFLSFSHIRW